MFFKKSMGSKGVGIISAHLFSVGVANNYPTHFGRLSMFAGGVITSFVSAFLCVRWLLRYISRHDFTLFAWYRIVFGLVVLATAYSGIVSWSVAP